MRQILIALLTLLLLTACTTTAAPAPTAVPASATPRATAPQATSTRPAPTAWPAATATTPAATAAVPATAAAPAAPDGSLYRWAPVARGLDQPVFLAGAGDGSGRLFIVEQPGRIRVVAGGRLLEAPFLDIVDRTGSRGTEQGLLGLAFHPDYARNGQFFVDYTDRNGDTVVSRFRVSTGDPDRAERDSEEIVLTIAQPYANHNGGQLVFGPDGYLYVGMGDGGAAGDPQDRAQNPQDLLGKLLRLDVDAGRPYAIPPGNPFAAGAGGRPEIWALGLRNPWRFSFDRLTGDLYIADVGQGTWEEVNFAPAGAAGGENFGWPYREGAHPYEGDAPAGLVEPVAEYSHAEGGCSVTGGYVYRGAALPALQGVYLYGDYCSGLVWGLWQPAPGRWETRLLFETRLGISSFGEDDAGELYVLDRGGGAAYLLAAQAQ